MPHGERSVKPAGAAPTGRADRLVSHTNPEAADVVKDRVDHTEARRALMPAPRMNDDAQQFVGKKVFEIGNLLIGKSGVLRKAQGVLDPDDEIFHLFPVERLDTARIAATMSIHTIHLLSSWHHSTC